jgi:tetratricopeptide (TPR) repeat protein
MGNRKPKPTKQKTPKPDRRSILHLEYEITDEPLHDPVHEALPEAVKEAIERLYDLSKDNPKQAIEELLELREQYPQVPKFDNFLSIAYSRDGQVEKAYEVVEISYRRHPEYLFARLNYAEFCLNNNQLDNIPEIFEHTFDLSLLFPERTKFHVSEFGGFAGIMGMYFYKKGETEKAKRYYQMLKRIVPEHGLTKQLGRLLAAPAVLEALQRVLGQENKQRDTT